MKKNQITVKEYLALQESLGNKMNKNQVYEMIKTGELKAKQGDHNKWLIEIQETPSISKMTVKECAEKFGLTTRQVNTMIKTGDLKASKSSSGKWEIYVMDIEAIDEEVSNLNVNDSTTRMPNDEDVCNCTGDCDNHCCDKEEDLNSPFDKPEMDEEFMKAMNEAQEFKLFIDSLSQSEIFLNVGEYIAAKFSAKKLQDVLAAEFIDDLIVTPYNLAISVVPLIEGMLNTDDSITYDVKNLVTDAILNAFNSMKPVSYLTDLNTILDSASVQIEDISSKLIKKSLKNKIAVFVKYFLLAPESLNDIIEAAMKNKFKNTKVEYTEV